MKTEHPYLLTKIILLTLLTLVLASCASTPRKHPSNQSTSNTKSSVPVTDINDQNKGLAIAQIAESMVGTNYRYGGSHPDEGFDCSGLVFYSHTKIGEQVPRVSYAQLAASDEVDKEDLQPGDLLFYRINGKPSHVGIYIGYGQFVHAPSSGKKVRVSSVENVYFKPRLIRAGRLYTNDD